MNDGLAPEDPCSTCKTYFYALFKEPRGARIRHDQLMSRGVNRGHRSRHRPPSCGSNRNHKENTLERLDRVCEFRQGQKFQTGADARTICSHILRFTRLPARPACPQSAMSTRLPIISRVYARPQTRYRFCLLF